MGDASEWTEILFKNLDIVIGKFESGKLTGSSKSKVYYIFLARSYDTSQLAQK